MKSASNLPSKTAAMCNNHVISSFIEKGLDTLFQIHVNLPHAATSFDQFTIERLQIIIIIVVVISFLLSHFPDKMSILNIF